MAKCEDGEPVSDRTPATVQSRLSGSQVLRLLATRQRTSWKHKELLSLVFEGRRRDWEAGLFRGPSEDHLVPRSIVMKGEYGTSIECDRNSGTSIDHDRQNETEVEENSDQHNRTVETTYSERRAQAQLHGRR